MGLVHHVVPAAIQQLVVVLIAQGGVIRKQSARLRCVLIGAGTALARVQCISSRCNVKLGEISAREDRVLHKFKERCALLFRELCLQFVDTDGKRNPLGFYAVSFVKAG